MGTFALRNFRSLELSLPGTFAPGYFRSLEHSLPNAKSKKTWSFHSPYFKCVFLSKVTRIASSMLNCVYRPARFLPSHQLHETVPSRNRSRRNQRTSTRGVIDCPPCSQLEEQLRWLASLLFERSMCVVALEQAIDYRYIST